MKKTCKISIAALVCVLVMSLLTGCGGNVDVIQYSDGRNIVQLLTFSLPNTARVNIEANAAVRVGDEKWTVSDYMRALTGLVGFADGSRFEYETEGVDGGDWFTRYVRRAPITDDGGEEDEPDENYNLDVKNMFYVRRVTVTVSHPFNGYRSDWDSADGSGGGLMDAIKHGITGKDFLGRDVLLLPALTDAFPSVSGSDLGHLVLSFGIPAGAFGASSGEDREIDGVKFHCFERLFTTDDEVISYSYTVPYSVGWYVTAILLGGAVTAAIIFATRKKKPKERHPDIFPYDPFDEGTGGGNNLPSGYNSANNNG